MNLAISFITQIAKRDCISILDYCVRSYGMAKCHPNDPISMGAFYYSECTLIFPCSEFLTTTYCIRPVDVLDA